jgi:hypothetical protein
MKKKIINSGKYKRIIRPKLQITSSKKLKRKEVI